jgi:guanine nucleotide-binding protein G(I)/G(S)/G(T) subunit beta-1
MTADRIKSAKSLFEALKKQVDDLRAAHATGSLRNAAIEKQVPSVSIAELRCTRTLKGHQGEVTSMSWSGDGVTLASVGKDGQVIVWNGLQNRKIQVINHATQWLMCCSFERTQNALVAAGGADRSCSIFITGQAGMVRPSAVLSGHDGYLSSCFFVNDKQLLTASGDSTVLLWDLTEQKIKTRFTEHAADCLTVTAFDDNIYASGSADSTVKIWDARVGHSTHTFVGHTSDVNSVVFFPNGQAVAAGSTDSTCRLFDIRSYSELACFDVKDSEAPVTSGNRFSYHEILHPHYICPI